MRSKRIKTVQLPAQLLFAPDAPVLTAAHSYHNQGIHSSFECLGLVHWVHHSYNLHYPAVGIDNSCSHYTGCWHHAEKPDG
jgi:hypothetical protein